MVVSPKIDKLRERFPSRRALGKTLEEARQEARIQDPEIRKAWGLEKESLEEQRSFDEKRGPVKPESKRPVQGDPEAKG